MGGGSPTQTTTTQKFEPPDYVTNYDGNGGNYFKDYLNQSAGLANRGYQPYDLPRIAPLNDLQNTGLNMAADYGINGTPVGNTARGLATATMQGQFLNGNPYTDQMINSTAANMARAQEMGTQAQTDAMAARNGAFGGSAWQQLTAMNGAQLANQVGQMANTARFNNYNTERGFQNQAMGMAPQFSADDQNAIKMVTGAGDAYNNYQQRLLDQSYSDFSDQRDAPQRALEQFAHALSVASGTTGAGGTTTGTTQVPGMSPLATMLGLGAGAYGVSQMLPGGLLGRG